MCFREKAEKKSLRECKKCFWRERLRRSGKAVAWNKLPAAIGENIEDKTERLWRRACLHRRCMPRLYCFSKVHPLMASYLVEYVWHRSMGMSCSKEGKRRVEFTAPGCRLLLLSAKTSVVKIGCRGGAGKKKKVGQKGAGEKKIQKVVWHIMFEWVIENDKFILVICVF